MNGTKKKKAVKHGLTICIRGHGKIMDRVSSYRGKIYQKGDQKTRRANGRKKGEKETPGLVASL